MSNDPPTSNEGGRVYVVTGSNSGIGLEAVRQLADQNNGKNNKIYMLCRSEERAKVAIEQIGNPSNVQFVKFDAYSYSNGDEKDDGGSSSATIKSSIPEDIVHGVLLNAGGFGEKQSSSEQPTTNENEEETSSKASKLAQLNLMGHVALVKDLLKLNKLRKGCRIVASGSEACIEQKLDWKKANFNDILLGKKPSIADYGWIKGIVGLYWSAFARHHPELYVVTVSPGAVKTTAFFQQQAVPGIVKFGAKVAIFFNGSHSVDQAAKRYLDSLLVVADEKDSNDNDNNNNVPPKTGSYLVHRKGYTNDFGDITTHSRGGAFGDTKLQDLAWEAVEGLLPANNN